MNAPQDDESMHDNENREDVGEQIPTPYLTRSDSEIRPGDRVFFRLRHDAFRNKPTLPELAGVVLEVMPGHEMCYVIKIVTTGSLLWPDRIVRRHDITKVFV